VVTRDFYSAILSGYLYHKKNMECALNHWGNPGFKQWLMQEDWEARILASNDTQGNRSWPEGRGRTLCDYLGEESETNGMKVYMLWSKALFLDHLVAFAQTRRQLEAREREGGGLTKTLFVCYEDLQQRTAPVAHRMAQWLFPDRPRVRTRGLRDGHRDDPGQHATTKRHGLTNRLLKTVRDLDHELFQGELERMGRETFGCCSSAAAG